MPEAPRYTKDLTSLYPCPAILFPSLFPATVFQTPKYDKRCCKDCAGGGILLDFNGPLYIYCSALASMAGNYNIDIGTQHLAQTYRGGLVLSTNDPNYSVLNGNQLIELSVSRTRSWDAPSPRYACMASFVSLKRKGMSGERLRFRRSWGMRTGAGGRARREGSFVDILPTTEGPVPPPPVPTSIIPDPSVDVGP